MAKNKVVEYVIEENDVGTLETEGKKAVVDVIAEAQKKVAKDPKIKITILRIRGASKNC